MTCPSCSASIAEQEPIGGLVICDVCLASVVAADGRRATSAETLVLTPAQVQALKVRRASFRAVQV